MSRIALVSYTAGSESVSILRDALNEQFDYNPARILLQEGTRFRGRSDNLIVNWGSARAIPDEVQGQAKVLNQPTAVNNAGNKVTALELMQREGVKTVEHTGDRTVAQQWVDEGHHVFARTELRGHSGDGIICVAETRPEALGAVEYSDTLPTAGLYTKGVTGLHREFRVHVFMGKVIFLQQKRRASGYSTNPSYSNIVRNHGNCWIYAHNNISTPNEACIDNALKSVAALGLDFGAVDVLTHQNDAWVLEVNTAPGQTGATTRIKYTDAIIKVFKGEEVEGLAGYPTFAGLTLLEGLARFPGAAVAIDAEEESTTETPVGVVAEPTPVAEAAPRMTTTYEAVGSYDELPVGTIVRIASTSPYHVENDISNPIHTDGEVTANHPGTLNIQVQWGNEDAYSNCYSASDLVRVVVTPEQPEILTEATISVGSVVAICPSSQYYGTSDTNPADMSGVVTSISSTNHHLGDGQHCVRVEWSNGNSNNYRFYDLITYVAPAAVDAVNAAPAVTHTPVTPSIPVEDKCFYKAEVDGTKTIVQYEESIDSFYMVGFDMPLEVGNVVALEKIEL